MLFAAGARTALNKSLQWEHAEGQIRSAGKWDIGFLNTSRLLGLRPISAQLWISSGISCGITQKDVISQHCFGCSFEYKWGLVWRDLQYLRWSWDIQLVVRISFLHYSVYPLNMYLFILYIYIYNEYIYVLWIYIYVYYELYYKYMIYSYIYILYNLGLIWQLLSSSPLSKIFSGRK